MKKLLLLALFILVSMTSCEKSEYDDRYWHQIAINPENTETYEFLDIADGVYQFYHTRQNGDGYTFEVNGDTVIITSEYKITEVRLFTQPLNKDYKVLPVKDNNEIVIIGLNPDDAIRIYHN